MSGSAGGTRIRREDVENTVKDYIEKVLKKFPGFVSAKISGSYNTLGKKDFGDIDLIVQLSGKDKKQSKVDLSNFFGKISNNLIVPFKSEKYKNKKVLNTGEIVTILYPIHGSNEFIQIDNIISMDEKEAEFKKSFLDYTASKQALILGLVKTAMLEDDPIKVLNKMGIKNIPGLKEHQEYEFNLSSISLTLRIVTLDNFKELNRVDVWKSSRWEDKVKLLSNYDLNTDFEDLLQQFKHKAKNPRSKNRVKGVFKSMLSVKSGEVNTPKADEKDKSLNQVAMLEFRKKLTTIVKEILSK